MADCVENHKQRHSTQSLASSAIVLQAYAFLLTASSMISRVDIAEAGTLRVPCRVLKEPRVQPITYDVASTVPTLLDCRSAMLR